MYQPLYGKQAKQEDYEQDQHCLHPDVAHGPLEERSCQDIFFFILYVLFWVGLFIIAGVAVKNGDPKRLATPFDSSGNQCGYDKGADYPYMFFSEEGVATISSKMYACVKQCPNQSPLSVNCLTNVSVTDCNQLQLYETVSFVNVCLPTNSDIQNQVKDQINVGTIEQWMSDIRTTWLISLAVAFISFAVSQINKTCIQAVFISLVYFYISLIFLFLMRTCTGFITWLMIFGYFVLLISLGCLCLYKAYNKQYQDVPSDLQNQQVLEALGYCLIILAGFSLIVFICFLIKLKELLQS